MSSSSSPTGTPRRFAILGSASLLVAALAAVTGWARDPTTVRLQRPSIAIVDVRPVQTDDPNLRDQFRHFLTVRVSIVGWRLLPYRPGAAAADNRPDAGHWRLYLDGWPLGDSYGDARVSYTPYVTTGAHWIAAELSNADGTSLRTPIWSEPVLLRVPRSPDPTP